MSRKNLNKEKIELGTSNFNKNFESIMPSKEIQELSKFFLNNQKTPLTEENIIKLGFKRDLINENEYCYTFEIVAKNGYDKITLISCSNKEAEDGKYTVRLFDTPFFMCKSVEDVQNVIKISLAYQK